MKTLKASALAVLIALAVSGCKAKPTFHVTYSNECADVPIVGTMQGIEYALTKPPGHDYIACYGLTTPYDVGKDFPAEIDPGTGEITLTLNGEKQAFAIEAAREAK